VAGGGWVFGLSTWAGMGGNLMGMSLGVTLRTFAECHKPIPGFPV
jgi:hypothetical protein